MSETKLEAEPGRRVKVGDYVSVMSIATPGVIDYGRVAGVWIGPSARLQVMLLTRSDRPVIWYDQGCLRWLDPATAQRLGLDSVSVITAAISAERVAAAPERRGPNLQNAPPRTEEGRAFQKAWAERYERSLDPVVAKVEKEPEPLPMAPSPGPRCPRCAGPAYVGLLSFVCEREGGCRTPEERVQARAAAGEAKRRVKVVYDRTKREDTFIFVTAYLAAKRADVQMFPSYAQAEAAWRAWALAEERER